MAGLIALLLLGAIILCLLCYLFFRSVLWVAEPLIEHFEDREAERFAAEDEEGSEIEEETDQNIEREKC